MYHCICPACNNIMDQPSVPSRCLQSCGGCGKRRVRITCNSCKKEGSYSTMKGHTCTSKQAPPSGSVTPIPKLEQKKEVLPPVQKKQATVLTDTPLDITLISFNVGLQSGKSFNCSTSSTKELKKAIKGFFETYGDKLIVCLQEISNVDKLEIDGYEIIKSPKLATERIDLAFVIKKGVFRFEYCQDMDKGLTRSFMLKFEHEKKSFRVFNVHLRKKSQTQTTAEINEIYNVLAKCNKLKEKLDSFVVGDWNFSRNNSRNHNTRLQSALQDLESFGFFVNPKDFLTTTSQRIDNIFASNLATKLSYSHELAISADLEGLYQKFAGLTHRPLVGKITFERD